MRLLPVLLLAACAGAADDDTADTDVAAACVALDDGTWTASGSCFGMRMTATLAFDEATCTFTLSDWDMEMSTPNPTGGAVDDHAVTLTGEPWTTCTATAAGPKRFTGTCETDCAFEFAYE